MATTIEPCPFCSGKHLHIHQKGLSYWIVCQSCRSEGPHCLELERAITQWNSTSRKIVGAAVTPPEAERRPAIAGRH